MKKAPKIRLTLHRETLRPLGVSELQNAQGGATKPITGTETISCPLSCVVCK
jgi:hypothetical protein